MVIRILFITIACLGSIFPLSAQTDYRQHTVRQGEDLIGVARQYSVNFGQLFKANPSTAYGGLAEGEILYIPQVKKTPVNDGTKKLKGYLVKSGETLFDICQRFRMDMEEIRTLNALPTDQLRAGQRLVVITDVVHRDFFEVDEEMLRPESTNTVTTTVDKVIIHEHTVEAKQTLYSIAKRYGISLEELRKQNGLNENSVIHIGDMLRIKEVRRVVVEKPKRVIYAHTETPEPTEKLIHESGIGIRIRQQRESDQKIALHRNAKVGSFIRVQNENTGRYCIVRVIGNFPAIQANRDVVIKISEAACRELGVVNDRFPIVVSRPQEEN
ncbi:MAG: LysM peptidoglycan-binding domain-containing protein [Bacteroidota bacterium]